MIFFIESITVICIQLIQIASSLGDREQGNYDNLMYTNTQSHESHAKPGYNSSILYLVGRGIHISPTSILAFYKFCKSVLSLNDYIF